MVYATLISLIIALVAGLFAFGGIASRYAAAAKIAFIVFMLVFLFTLVSSAVRAD